MDVGGFREQWHYFHTQRWSKYDSETYQQVIDLIRKSSPDEPLWRIEKHWRGHQ